MDEWVCLNEYSFTTATAARCMNLPPIFDNIYRLSLKLYLYYYSRTTNMELSNLVSKVT